jgi:phosphate starvation-inducible protein PhoH
VNGLSDFLDKYNKRVEHEIYGIGMVKLEREDILRSNIVSQILKLYYKEEYAESEEPEPKPKPNNDCALIPKDLFKNI